MTCAHVLGLIDAGPFAGYTRHHLEAAWQHARGCARCGPALRASAVLTSELKRLALPALPPDVTSVVLARIARFDEQQAALGAAAAGSTDARRRPDWEAWVPAAGALQASVAIALAMAVTRVTDEPAASVRGPEWISVASSPWSLVLLTSLMLYAASLYAPLRQRPGDDPAASDA